MDFEGKDDAAYKDQRIVSHPWPTTPGIVSDPKRPKRGNISYIGNNMVNPLPLPLWALYMRLRTHKKVLRSIANVLRKKCLNGQPPLL